MQLQQNYVFLMNFYAITFRKQKTFKYKYFEIE